MARECVDVSARSGGEACGARGVIRFDGEREADAVAKCRAEAERVGLIDAIDVDHLADSSEPLSPIRRQVGDDEEIHSALDLAPE